MKRGIVLFVALSQAALLYQNVAASNKSMREDFVCPGDGSFPIPGECSSNYYVCDAGEAYPAVCPGSMIFDPEISSCVASDFASCKEDSTESTVTTRSTTPSTSSSSPPPFTCPGDGNFPIPGTCGSDYYICVGGVAYPGTCPDGSIFDPELLVCVAAGTASCEDGVTSTSRTTTPSASTTKGPFVCPEPDGLFPDPGECETYYVCSGGNPILQYCPPSLVFNPETNQCDYPLNVPDCAPFRCPEPEGNFANPEDCHTFWTCNNNRPFLQQCPPTLVFNPDIGACDFISNVPSCQNASTTAAAAGARAVGL